MVKETVPQIAGTSITTTAKVFTAAGVSIITLQNALAEKNGACKCSQETRDGRNIMTILV